MFDSKLSLEIVIPFASFEVTLFVTRLSACIMLVMHRFSQGVQMTDSFQGTTKYIHEANGCLAEGINHPCRTSWHDLNHHDCLVHYDSYSD